MVNQKEVETMVKKLAESVSKRNEISIERAMSAVIEWKQKNRRSWNRIAANFKQHEEKGFTAITIPVHGE